MTDCHPVIDGTWKNFVTDFGAVADGVTNSSPAVDAWLTWAKAHDGSKLYIPPGNYHLGGTNAPGIGVNNATFSGYGASFDIFTMGKVGTLQEDTTHSARIQTASIGATSVTLVTAAQISRFAVGQWMLVSGLSLQHYGYPINSQYNEYRQISGIAGSTISFTTPLTFAYLSTWPGSVPIAGSIDLGGPATAYALRSDFAGTQTYLGIRTTQSDQVTTTGGENFFVCGMTFENEGICPTVGKSFIVKNCAIGSGVEIDKAIEYLEFDNCTSTGQIAGQSSSVTQLTIKNNCQIPILNGTPQNTTIQDSTVGEVIAGPLAYGASVKLTAINSSIGSTRQPIHGVPVSGVTFNAGTFATPFGSRPNIMESAVPGHKYFFAYYNGVINKTADGTGLVTSFTVTAVRQDATNIYMDTDLGPVLPTPTFQGGSPANYYVPYAATTVTQTNSGPADLTQWAAPKLTGDLMARDFIKIDTGTTTATQANLLKNYVQQLRQAYDTGKRVVAVMSHSNDGTVFTDIETIFGLPAGKGQTVFNLVNGSIGSMEGTFQVADAKTITEQMG